jgi:hypothetical protein
MFSSPLSVYEGVTLMINSELMFLIGKRHQVIPPVANIAATLMTVVDTRRNQLDSSVVVASAGGFLRSKVQRQFGAKPFL